MLKKVLALALAGAMVLGSMSLSAFAEVGGLSVNGQLKVAGLDKGDVVTYYKVIGWNQTETADTTQGWQWNTNVVTGLTPEQLTTVIGTSDGNGVISAETAGKIAAALVDGSGTTSEALTGTEWTATVTEPGLYMVIVDPATPGTMYNPIFVAANWYGTDEVPDSSNQIAVSANELSYNPAAMAKKSTIPLDKKAKGTDAPNGQPTAPTNNGLADGAYTADTGEEIAFQVTTHVPKFAENYTKPVFKLTDKLNGLDLVGGSVTVKKYDKDNDVAAGELPSGSYTISNYQDGDHEYTVTFTPDYLKALNSFASGDARIPDAGQDVIIEYRAKVNDDATKIVNQKDNTVDLVFSTTPDDDEGHGLLRDQTNHFVFSIDADLLGHGEINESSNELVKIGVDAEGNVIVSSSHYEWSDEWHGPLQGAQFKLYTNEECTTPYTNKTITADTVFTSDGTGRVTIQGLDAGVYYLKETKAPEGYVKMQDKVKITITADIDTEYTVKQEVDNDGTPVEVTYVTNKLNGYTVTFEGPDGTATSNYTITLSESSAIAASADYAASPASSDFEVKNTKGIELPSTGGIGTTLFYAGGAVLVLLAGVLLVSKRRIA